eukprot:UN03088
MLTKEVAIFANSDDSDTSSEDEPIGDFFERFKQKRSRGLIRQRTAIPSKSTQNILSQRALNRNQNRNTINMNYRRDHSNNKSFTHDVSNNKHVSRPNGRERKDISITKRQHQNNKTVEHQSKKFPMTTTVQSTSSTSKYFKTVNHIQPGQNKT